MTDLCTFYLDNEDGQLKFCFNNELLAYNGVDVELFVGTFSNIKAQDFVEYVLYIEDKSGRVREIGQYCKDIKSLIAIRDMYNSNPLFETAYIMKRTTRHEFVPEDDLLKYVDEQK